MKEPGLVVSFCIPSTKEAEVRGQETQWPEGGFSHRPSSWPARLHETLSQVKGVVLTSRLTLCQVSASRALATSGL